MLKVIRMEKQVAIICCWVSDMIIISNDCWSSQSIHRNTFLYIS